MCVQWRTLAVAGAVEFSPQVLRDDRGLFVSPYQEAAFEEAVGRPLFPVAQTNHSHSRRGTVRGVHFTCAPPGTAKYVYCARGKAIDVVVDVRVGSPTYGVCDAVQLDPENFRAVYFPLGVGHAFIVLEDDTVMSYLQSGRYVPEHELAISPLDPALGMPIPAELDVILSDRDKVAPTLDEACRNGVLPRYADTVALEKALYR